MACPRCGGRLERYELSDRVEAACVDCGYVGVPVDHGSERARQESWTAAMERVEGQFDGTSATATAVGPAPPPLPDEGDGDPQPRTVRTDTGTTPVVGVAADAAGPADGSEATADGATTEREGRDGSDAADDTEDATTEHEGEDGSDAADDADGETPNGEEGDDDGEGGGESEREREGESEGEREGEGESGNENESGTDAASGTPDGGD